MQLAFTVEISRALDEVFHVVANLENDPRWQSAVIATTKLTEGPVGNGTRFEHQLRLLGQSARVSIEFSEFRSRSSYRLRADWGSLSFDTDVRFEPISAGTRLSVVVGAPHLTGLARIAVAALSRHRQREIEADLVNLKAQMEAGRL
jgi:uncharacterized membrane protein